MRSSLLNSPTLLRMGRGRSPLTLVDDFPRTIIEMTDNARFARMLAATAPGGMYEGHAINVDNAIVDGEQVPWELVTDHVEIDTPRTKWVADRAVLFNQNTWGVKPCVRGTPNAIDCELPFLFGVNVRGMTRSNRFRFGSQIWGVPGATNCATLVWHASGLQCKGVHGEGMFVACVLFALNAAGTGVAARGDYREDNHVDSVTFNFCDFGLFHDGQRGMRVRLLRGSYIHTVPGQTAPTHAHYGSNQTGNYDNRIEVFEALGSDPPWTQLVSVTTGYAGTFTLTPRLPRGTMGCIATNPNVTNASTSWADGDEVTCAAFPAGTTVLSGGGTTNLVMSNPSTVTAPAIRAYRLSATPITILATDAQPQYQAKLDAHPDLSGAYGPMRANGGYGSVTDGYNLPPLPSAGMALTFIGLEPGNPQPPLMKIDTTGITGGSVSLAQASAGGASIIKSLANTVIETMRVDGCNNILAAGNDCANLTIENLEVTNLEPGSVPLDLAGHNNHIRSGYIEMLSAQMAFKLGGTNCSIKNMEIRTAWDPSGATNQNSYNFTYGCQVGGDRCEADVSFINADPACAAPIQVLFDDSFGGIWQVTPWTGHATVTAADDVLRDVTPTEGWANGQKIIGAGIPVDTTILSGAGTSEMKMSAAATAAGSDVVLTSQEQVQQRGARVRLRGVKPAKALLKSAAGRSTVEPDVLSYDPVAATELANFAEIIGSGGGRVVIRRDTSSPLTVPGRHDRVGRCLFSCDPKGPAAGAAALASARGAGSRFVIPFDATLSRVYYNLAGGTLSGNLALTVFGDIEAGNRVVRWTTGSFAVSAAVPSGATVGWKYVEPGLAVAEGEIIEVWIANDTGLPQFLRIATTGQSAQGMTPDTGYVCPTANGQFPYGADNPTGVSDGGYNPSLQLLLTPV